MNPERNAIYGQFGRVAKALANPIRLELLDLLCQAPRTVETLAGLVGQSVATTSHHLRALHAAHLVVSEKRGVYVTYRLAGEDVCAFWLALQRLAQNYLAEVRQVAREYLEETGSSESADRTTLLAKLRRGEVTLIDVRPREEYDTGHIPGALSVPLERLEELLPSLPAQQELVTYGRGPFCALSHHAVKLLQRNKRKAVRIPEGIPQWRAAGLPIEGRQSNQLRH